MSKITACLLFFFLFSLPASGQQELEWNELDIAISTAKTTSQGILVYIHAPWCGVCLKMEKEVFPLSHSLLGRFERAKLDLSDMESHIQIGKRSLSPFEWAQHWNVDASPGFVFLDSSGELIRTVVGYMDKHRFEMLLKYIADENNKEGEYLDAPVKMTTNESGGVKGQIISAGRPVPFANVAIKGTTLGAAADISGNFEITDIPVGTHRLVAAAVGFKTADIGIDVHPGRRAEVTFALTETVHEMDGIMVTGTLVETFVKDSPVKVNVVSPHYLDKIPTANIMEVLENVNGLYQQIDCGVCGTNNIRINGMDGPYTAVLIDGMPIMSSLATVYGLNGISPSLLQQVEIIKGPMSTLYGSEAMGGVINIITKNPQNAPRMAINSFGSGDGEYALDIGIVPSRGKISSLLSGTFFYNNRFHDDNKDNFADLVLNTRFSIFNKLAITDKKGFKKASFSARYYFEDRLGGTKEFIRAFSNALRGSRLLYGESIRTNRLEAVGNYFFSSSNQSRIDLAFNSHIQDSFYGADSYQANQSTGFAQLVSPITLNDRHSLQIGAAIRFQQYDDNTGVTGVFDGNNNQTKNNPDNRLIPGVFTQYEYIGSPKVRLLTGMRIDYQKDYGIIPSPRASLRLNPGDNTTIRVNGGTGFRIVNLFTEDHAAYTGARATVLLEDLKPERSINSTISLQHIFKVGYSPLTIDIEGFYTYFTNKIEPDYSRSGLIQYGNLEGSATTRGVSLTIAQSINPLNINYTIGGTLMDVYTENRGTSNPLEFAPDYQAVGNISYLFEPLGLTFDYTFNLTGPMKLPEYEAPFARDPFSPSFSIHNLQVTKDFPLPKGDIFQAYIASENIFNYTQPTPLVDPQNPFGDRFDTAYVYGPIHGGHIGFGARYTMR
ncbi:MAG: TonB-dependent receptor plug domain-containing protein [Rhodothermaceae bacterium]|nr:TonB-dependent receptor plug domain-containing protein [Rhodothermaceae bacterium]